MHPLTFTTRAAIALRSYFSPRILFFFTLLFLIPSSETDVQCGAGHVDIKVELQEASYGAAAHKAWFEDVMAAKSIENSRSLLEQQAKTF